MLRKWFPSIKEDDSASTLLPTSHAGEDVETTSRRLHHSFRSSWSDCALASWRKYPTPRRPDVLSVDIINKHLDPETGQLHATRLIIVRGWLPKWIQTFTGSNVCFFVEHSITDPREERLVLSTQNLSYSNLIELTETCIYTKEDGMTKPSRQEDFREASASGLILRNPIAVSADDGKDLGVMKKEVEIDDWADGKPRTHLEQRAEVKASVFGLRRKLEEYCIERYTSNAIEGRTILEETITRVVGERDENSGGADGLNTKELQLS